MTDDAKETVNGLYIPKNAYFVYLNNIGYKYYT